MNENLKGLRVPAAIAVVIVVAGEKISNEVLERVYADPSYSYAFNHLSRTLLIYGAAHLAVGVLAVVVCRKLGVARGVSATVALGAGLAIAGRVLTIALDLIVDAGYYTWDNWTEHIHLLIWVNRLTTTWLLAAIIFVGLFLARVQLRAALSFVALFLAVRWGVGQIDELRFEHRELLRWTLYYLFLVGTPVACALGALYLPRRAKAEEPVPV